MNIAVIGVGGVGGFFGGKSLSHNPLSTLIRRVNYCANP